MTMACFKELLDTAEAASQLTDSYAALCSGIHPRHIRMLEQIAVKNQAGCEPMPSDISEILGVTRPGITRTLSELREMGYVNKTVDAKDNRVYHLSLTEEGWNVYEQYVLSEQAAVQEALEGVDEDKILEAASVLKETFARLIRAAESSRRKTNAPGRPGLAERNA